MNDKLLNLKLFMTYAAQNRVNTGEWAKFYTLVTGVKVSAFDVLKVIKELGYNDIERYHKRLKRMYKSADGEELDSSYTINQSYYVNNYYVRNWEIRYGKDVVITNPSDFWTPTAMPVVNITTDHNLLFWLFFSPSPALNYDFILGHFREYSKRSLQLLLSRSGFKKMRGRRFTYVLLHKHIKWFNNLNTCQMDKVYADNFRHFVQHRRLDM